MPFADAIKGQKALERLTGRGYTVVDIPPLLHQQPDPMRAAHWFAMQTAPCATRSRRIKALEDPSLPPLRSQGEGTP